MNLPKVRIVNFPRTQTIIAIGLLIGCSYVLTQGDEGPAMEMARLFRDGMLIILGFYFAKDGENRSAARDKLLLDAGPTTATTTENATINAENATVNERPAPRDHP